MAELLDNIRAQIDARIAELRPLVEEADRLERALGALRTSTARETPRASTGAPRRRTISGSTRRRRHVPMGAAVIDYIRAPWRDRRGGRRR
jgi:hypothetical protein